MMSNSIHGLRQGGAGGASFSSPQDGASGSAPVELPQEDPIDIFEIIAGWLEKYGNSSPKAPPSYGAFHLLGCQSPFSSAPARPIPQPPRRSIPQWSVTEVAKSQWMNIAGMIVPYGSKDVTESVHEELGMILIQIPTDFRYEGIPVSQGVAFFYQDNRQLAKFTLSEDFDLKIGEYSVPVAAGQWLDLPRKAGPVPEDQDVSQFYLEWVTLYREWEFNGNRLAAESRVAFNDRSQLVQGFAKPGSIIQGYPIIGPFSFHKNKKLQAFLLAEKAAIQGIDFKKGDDIYLDQQGQLTAGRATSKTIIQGYPIIGSFDFENKQLVGFRLAEDTTIQGIDFKKGTYIHRNKQGRLIKATIRESHTILGKNYDPNLRIFFNDKGKVRATEPFCGRQQLTPPQNGQRPVPEGIGECGEDLWLIDR